MLPQQRGFRPKPNSLVLLLGFFLVGLFLHYGGRTKPVVAFWNDIRRAVGLSTGRYDRANRNEPNPYKAPEPTDNQASDSRPYRHRRNHRTDTEASDNRSGSSSQASDGGASSTESSSPANARFDFEKQPNFLLPTGKSQGQLVEHQGYTLDFRDAYKQADWVAYPLLDTHTYGDAERKNEQFKPDPTVETGSATPADYVRSGYDRGHLAPAGDFKFSQQMMSESFYMSNVSPQAPQFNRGIWEHLEEQVRSWANRDRGLYVVTGPILKPGLPTIGRQNQVAVPEQYYKVLLYCNSPKIRMIGFLLRNEPSDQPLPSFVVPVSQIEALTGLTFFPKIPVALQQKLKNQSSTAMTRDWFNN